MKVDKEHNAAPSDLPAGMLKLLADAEQFTYQLIKTQQ